MEKKILAGGISGGIADPDSERAIRHAETFYEGLRHRNDDVAKIAANRLHVTGFTNRGKRIWKKNSENTWKTTIQRKQKQLTRER